MTSDTPSVPIIKRRTPANKCRYLVGRVDELIDNADKLSARKFSAQSLTLLFSLSEALEEFAPILEEVERGS